MINWVGTKKTEDNVKKDVDKSDKIVHDNTITMEQALENYIKKIGDDYENWTLGSRSLLSNDNIEKRIRDNSVLEFKNSLDYRFGSKYIKIVTNNGGESVHSFIVCTDNDKKFKYGDILKAASWKTPARNFARGNVFEEYKVRWTGAI